MNDLTSHDPVSPTVTGKRVVLGAALFLLLCPILIASWIAAYGYRTGPEIQAESVVVNIPRGTSVRGISRILGDGGIIDDDIRFILLARITGTATRLRAGEFRFATAQTPLEILQQLVEAIPIQHAVTLPEGLRARQMAEIFAGKGWCDKDEYLTLVSDRSIITEVGLEGVDSLEGYLYPDTYYFSRDSHGAKNIIVMQVHRFQEIWKQLISEYSEKVDRHEVVILASMVEKEAGVPEERAEIAAVFFNRLKKKMKLQSDPTVVYDLPDAGGAITRKQLNTATPYNTYIIPALPIGPIANPGREALHAVLYPAESNSLYFVAKNDGTHQFSTNLNDHNRAVRKYQRKKGRKSGTK